MEYIPTYGIDGHMMRIERAQRFIVVRFRALMNFAFFSADNEQIVLLLIEIETCATTLIRKKKKTIESIGAYRRFSFVHTERYQRNIVLMRVTRRLL
jgi:hypothetical protein